MKAICPIFVVMCWIESGGCLYGIDAIARPAGSTLGNRRVAVPDDSASAERIRQAIRLLGSVDFDQRERARQNLIRAGGSAWDALRVAETDSDLEIALQAKFLLKKLLEAGPVAEDPRESHALLDRYAAQTEQERVRRGKELAKLTTFSVVATLSRIVQFEESEWVSRRAALAIMQRSAPKRLAERNELANILANAAFNGDRVGLRWLRAYAETLREPRRTKQIWAPLLTDATAPALGHNSSRSEGASRSDSGSIQEQAADRAFLQWYVESLLQLGWRREAEIVAVAFVQQLPNDVTVWLDSLDWLIRCRVGSGVVELEQKFPLQTQDPDFGYRLAIAAQLRGDRAHSESIVQHVLQRPMVEAADRIKVGSFLVERGMFDAARREYDLALDERGVPAYERVYLFSAKASLFRAQGDIDEAIRQYQLALDFPADEVAKSPEGDRLLQQSRLLLRIHFAEMLHDQGKDMQAADVLKSLAEPSGEEAGEEVKRISDELEMSPVARREFFLAEVARRQHDQNAQIQHLTAGQRSAPEDVDILIALYRIPGYGAHAEVRQAIRLLARRIRQETIDMMSTLGRFDDSLPEQDRVNDLLAKQLNLYAWLVGNTEGDFADALRCSQRSLELQPNQAGFIDTLARCYYAVNDWGQALRYQEMAVDLEPYSGQMNSQLTLFLQQVPAIERPTNASSPRVSEAVPSIN